MADGWEERDSGKLVILGDGKDQQKKVAGLLAAIKQDRTYPDNFRYELIQQDGTALDLAGTTTINSKIGKHDIGRFVKVEFIGWESGKRQRYKNFKVLIYTGAPTDEMKAWPRWKELNEQGGAAKAQAAVPAPGVEPPPVDDFPPEDDSDGSLPF
jgi:hypothetical protein